MVVVDVLHALIYPHRNWASKWAGPQKAGGNIPCITEYERIPRDGDETGDVSIYGKKKKALQVLDNGGLLAQALIW